MHIRTLVEANYSTIILEHRDTELHCQIILGMKIPIPWGGSEGGCGKLSLEIMRLQTGSISVAYQQSTSHLLNTFNSLFLPNCSPSSFPPCLVRSFCSPFRTLTPFLFSISAFLSFAHLYLCSHCSRFQLVIEDLTNANYRSFFLG